MTKDTRDREKHDLKVDFLKVKARIKSQSRREWGTLLKQAEPALGKVYGIAVCFTIVAVVCGVCYIAVFVEGILTLIVWLTGGLIALSQLHRFIGRESLKDVVKESIKETQPALPGISDGESDD